MIVSKALYDLVVDSRPFKLGADEVGYREADSDAMCQNCVHFYARVVDKFHTCEIFRDDRTDFDGIQPDWTCSFHTTDGKTFPLLGK